VTALDDDMELYPDDPYTGPEVHTYDPDPVNDRCRDSDALMVAAYLDRKGPHVPGTDFYDGSDGSIEDDSRCPACGDPIDYCRGHGEIGDPLGADILKLHDLGLHQDCNLLGCDEAARLNGEAGRLATTTYTPVSEEVAVGLLAEGVHTGLRKGTYAHGSAVAWRAIARDDSGWEDAIRFAVSGLDFMGYVICKKSAP